MMVAIVTAEGAKNKSAELSSHLGAGQLLVVAMFLICAMAGVRRIRAVTGEKASA